MSYSKQTQAGAIRGIMDDLGVVTAETNDLTGGSVFSVGGVTLDLPSARGATAAVLGDSFSARNVGATSSRPLDYGYFTWAQAIMGTPFSLVLNAGVAGERTDQILARVPTVVAAVPDWCFVQGGINDITAAVATATIVSNLQTICTTLTNSGINVVLLSVAPNSQSAGNSVNVQTVNQSLREWAGAAKGVVFVDTYAAMVNSTATTGALNTGMSDDALHPSCKGARAMGQAIASAISGVFLNRNFLPSSNGESYGISNTSKQLLDNPMLATGGPSATGTGASGTVPLSWLGSVSGSASSAVFTNAVARTDGIGYDHQIVVTGASSGGSVNIRQSGLNARLAIGDTIYIVGQVKVSGASDLRTINLGCNVTIDGTTYQCNTMEASGSTNYDQSDVTLTLQSPPMVLTGASISAVSFIASAVFGTSGAGAATIKFGRLGLFKK